MKPTLYIFALILNISYLHSQVSESFETGSLGNNSTWEGNVIDFKINDQQQLQLQAQSAGNSYINTPIFINQNDTFFWDFWFNLKFAPSANNQFRFYLMASEMNFTSATLEGIYIEIGENGSNDPIKLVKQNGLSHTLIGTGIAGVAAKMDVDTRIRVFKTPANLFLISVDTNGFFSFVSDFQAYCTPNFMTNYLGIWCKYTQSNTQNFYFDDFNFGSFHKDTNAPILKGCKVLGSQKIALTFNEPLHNPSLNNFQVANQPIQSISLDVDARKLHIDFSSELMHEVQHNLFISQITDTALNVSQDTNCSFTYIKPVPFDLIINEFLADPNPSIGLPSTDYIELYNSKNYDINSINYKLYINNSYIGLPERIIPAKSYALIIPNTYLNYFPGLNTLPVSNFNIGMENTELTISDTGNFIIDKVSFHKSWYQDPIKAEGGFSLERIHINENCLQAPNFIASNSYTGGTPGYQNSVYQATLIPLEAKMSIIDSQKVLIVLNKYTDLNEWTLNNFTDLSNLPIFSQIQFNDGYKIIGELVQTIENNQELAIKITYAGNDCNGILNTMDTILKSLHYIPKFGDLILSEIMAAPKSSTVYPFEYIEILNRTGLNISLKDFSIKIGNSTHPLVDYIIKPGEYVALSSSLQAPTPFIYNHFSTLSNENGHYTLLHKSGELIHIAEYQKENFEDSHKKLGGYSLELSDINAYCTQDRNWKESLSPHGGTPAQANSQQIEIELQKAPNAVYRGVNEDSIYVYLDNCINPSSLKTAQLWANQTMLQGEFYADPSNLKLIKFKSTSSIPWSLKLELKNLNSCETNEKSNSSIHMPNNEISAKNGLQINEVLYYPLNNKSKYIEFMNVGDSAISLYNIYVGKYDTSFSTFQSGNYPFNKHLWLLPNEILCLTIDPYQISNDYTQASAAHILKSITLDLPSSAGAFLAVKNASNEIIDLVHINPDFHTSFISDKKGIALERTYAKSNGLHKQAWSSASTSSNYGTPGSPNSQWIHDFIATQYLELNSEIFSPDLDGYEDLLQIKCLLPQAGNQISLSIINEYGQIVKNLVTNEIAGTNFTCIWDGAMNNGIKAPIGIYKVQLNGFTQKGDKLTSSQIVVLATRK